MSSPPPEDPDAGVEVSVTEARGAVNSGVIWILVISLVLATVALLGLWLAHSHSLSTVTHPHARDGASRDISTYQEGSPTPRESAAGQPAANAQ